MPKAEEMRFLDRYSAKKLGRRLLYVLLILVLLLIIKAKLFTPPEVLAVRVARRDVTSEVQGTGTVGVDVLAEVGAKIPGRIARVFVDERSFVHKGQVIAELEDTDLQRELERAQARLEAVRATEKSAQAAEQARRATQWQAERAWQRERHLLAVGAVSQEEADQYEERSRTSASDIAGAQAQIGAAQRDVAAAIADVQLQAFRLSESKIFSYVSGIVTSLPKRPGDAIVAGEPVATVADPHLILVNAYVDQRFSGSLRVGQPVTVILRGRPHSPLQGRVYRVSPQADPSAEEMTVEVTFPLSPDALELGQWADVYIQIGTAQNALAIPQSAVMLMGNRRILFVAGSDHRVRQVEVEELARSPRSPLVAIGGNVQAGDWVLLKPMSVHPGQRVRIKPSSAAGDAP